MKILKRILWITAALALLFVLGYFIYTGTHL